MLKSVFVAWSPETGHDQFQDRILRNYQTPVWSILELKHKDTALD